MKPGLFAILALIVLIPVGLLAALGVRLARDEREMVRHRLDALVDGRLADVDASIARLLEQRGRELERVTEIGSFDPASIRAAVRGARLVRQMFVLDGKGRLEFPSADKEPTETERAFLARTDRIWKDKERFARPSDGTTAAASGWYAWYADNDLNLIFWRRAEGGKVVGTEVDRIALAADIVAALPDTAAARSGTADTRLSLTDSAGRAVYEWGAYEPGKKEKPRAALPLSAPLGSWKLSYFAPASDLDATFGKSSLLPAMAGAAALALVLGGLAVLVYRESSREARLAHERVTFVNQVSHELKTPLTNIRMYAELLEDSLDEGDERSAAYLKVVVDESRRLTRLIGNVLAFARKDRHKLALRLAPGCVDDLVAAVIAQFRPALEGKNVKIRFEAGAPGIVMLDPDAAGQILGNLLSNVEKYGAAGGLAHLETRAQGGRTTILVADKGPGVPAAERERIFEPFHRLSDKATDGVSGTGIGLTIARELARLHGGDVRLVDASEGAAFEVTLDTPPAEGGCT
ncbi:MAG: HAMP domain-containing sensor histidine kinase [Deltaproteobacteria bacterium]|nr:HAMP domain-containing sensor histidine kinase [Deltaproteobacteria bacterium]